MESLQITKMGTLVDKGKTINYLDCKALSGVFEEYLEFPDTIFILGVWYHKTGWNNDTNVVHYQR